MHQVLLDKYNTSNVFIDNFHLSDHKKWLIITIDNNKLMNNSSSEFMTKYNSEIKINHISQNLLETLNT